MATSLRRVKEVLETTEAENDVHPLAFASFSYGVWSQIPGEWPISFLPALEHVGQLKLSCQEAYSYPDTKWRLINDFIKPFTGISLLRLEIFDGNVDWKFLRGETILKLHRLDFDRFSNPEYSVEDRKAESEIFRYCFDNTKFPHPDKPLVSYFDAYEFSPQFIGRVIEVSGPHRVVLRRVDHAGLANRLQKLCVAFVRRCQKNVFKAGPKSVIFFQCQRACAACFVK